MSSQKLIKKYIGSDQVGSSQLEIENNSALRSLSADGLSSQDLLKLDPSNLLQLLKHPYLPGPATAPEQAARQQEVDEVAYEELSENQVLFIKFIKIG